MRIPMDSELQQNVRSGRLWRLNNLYQITDKNGRAGTIAHTLQDARAIFRDKIRFPYDNLPDVLKTALPAQNDNSCELLLANNSSIRVGVSLRSSTLQYLHISEYGKICAKFPHKA